MIEYVIKTFILKTVFRERQEKLYLHDRLLEKENKILFLFSRPFLRRENKKLYFLNRFWREHKKPRGEKMIIFHFKDRFLLGGGAYFPSIGILINLRESLQIPSSLCYTCSWVKKGLYLIFPKDGCVKKFFLIFSFTCGPSYMMCHLLFQPIVTRRPLEMLCSVIQILGQPCFKYFAKNNTPLSEFLPRV